MGAEDRGTGQGLRGPDRWRWTTRVPRSKALLHAEDRPGSSPVGLEVLERGSVTVRLLLCICGRLSDAAPPAWGVPLGAGVLVAMPRHLGGE